MIRPKLYAVISDASHTAPQGHPQSASGVRYQKVSTTYNPQQRHRLACTQPQTTKQHKILKCLCAGTVPSGMVAQRHFKKGSLDWFITEVTQQWKERRKQVSFRTLAPPNLHYWYLGINRQNQTNKTTTMVLATSSRAPLMTEAARVL